MAKMKFTKTEKRNERRMRGKQQKKRKREEKMIFVRPANVPEGRRESPYSVIRHIQILQIRVPWDFTRKERERIVADVENSECVRKEERACDRGKGRRKKAVMSEMEDGGEDREDV